MMKWALYLSKATHYRADGDFIAAYSISTWALPLLGGRPQGTHSGDTVDG